MLKNELDCGVVGKHGRAIAVDFGECTAGFLPLLVFVYNEPIDAPWRNPPSFPVIGSRDHGRPVLRAASDAGLGPIANFAGIEAKAECVIESSHLSLPARLECGERILL